MVVAFKHLCVVAWLVDSDANPIVRRASSADTWDMRSVLLAPDGAVDVNESAAWALPAQGANGERTLTEARHQVFELGGSDEPWQREAIAILGSHLDNIGCPLVRDVEPDYPYMAAILQILNDIGRPFYLGGGSGINLLRFGSLSVRPSQASERRIALDDDFDFAVYSRSDEEREALNSALQEGCHRAGIFAGCTNWFRMTYSGSGLATGLADFYDLRDLNETHLHLKHWGGGPWVIERDVMLPFRSAKYYDLRVPVPRKALRFFSEAVPWDPRQRFPEYGSGCDGMAYPSFVAKALAGGRQKSPESVVSDLKQCARRLKKAGYASFSQCF